jgi:hypothetical protein
LFWDDNFELSQEDDENDFYTDHETDFVTQYASTNP